MQRSGRWRETPSTGRCGGSVPATPWPSPSMTSSSSETRWLNDVLMWRDRVSPPSVRIRYTWHPIAHESTRKAVTWCLANWEWHLNFLWPILRVFFPGPGGTGGGEGGSAEGCLFTWRGLPVAGQPERSGVRRGHVPTGLPRALGCGGRFLTEKLSHATGHTESPDWSCYCFESNSFFFFFLKYSCCSQLALFH